MFSKYKINGLKYKCKNCSRTFYNNDNLTIHEIKCNRKKYKHISSICEKRFLRKTNCNAHEDVCRQKLRNRTHQSGDGAASSSSSSPASLSSPPRDAAADNNTSLHEAGGEFYEHESAVGATVYKKVLNMDYFQFEKSYFKSVSHKIYYLFLEKLEAFKWSVVIDCFFSQATDNTITTATPISLWSEPQTLLPSEPHLIATQTKITYNNLVDHIDGFQQNGSGWILDRITSLSLRIIKYNPLRTGGYIKTPKELSNPMKGLVNIDNQRKVSGQPDEKCFVWSVLAHLHPAPDFLESGQRNKNKNRLKFYEEYENELNTRGMQFPVAMKDIVRFERQNQIGINIFKTTSAGKIFPTKRTSIARDRTTINLLEIRNTITTHFILISDLSRLVRSQLTKTNTIFTCPNCLQYFYNMNKFNLHTSNCINFKVQAITMPRRGDCLEFNSPEKQFRQPFIVIADAECLLQKSTKTFGPKTIATQKHVPCGVAFKILSTDPAYYHSPVLLTGENCMVEFLDRLYVELNDIQAILR